MPPKLAVGLVAASGSEIPHTGLHLAKAFGLGDETAIRYVSAAENCPYVAAETAASEPGCGGKI
jgi:hypothetical protein